MNKQNNSIRLKHIYDAILEIENYTKNIELEQFITNSMIFNATVRQLEFIGEVAKKLSEDFILENNQIPWQKMIGLRNILIHNYFGVDDIMVWNIIKINIPTLKNEIEKITQIN